MQRANIRWSWEFKQVEAFALKALYDAVGFTFTGPIDDDDMGRLFGTGIFGLFAFADDKLVGAARAFSDDVLVTWLVEMCVDPGWRGRGIGRSLLDRINDRFRVDIIDDSVLELAFVVPSKWLAWLKPGHAFTAAIEETGKTYPATVARVGARSDPVSRR